MSAVHAIRSYAALVEQAAARRTASADAAEARALGPAIAGSPAFVPPTPPAAPSPVASALDSVHAAGRDADRLVIDLASGRDVSVADTMVGLEQADIALKFAVQLRNRALAAYEELMRTQI
jgi:flagellar hook-basal body complex protein FliE